MSFGQPLLLLTLLAIPAALAARRLLERRRMRYAIRFTNVDVLASLVPVRTWRRHVAPALLALAVAALCVAVARPHATTSVTSDKAAVILVLDVSGSMQAVDVKPTRLIAAQQAIHTFLEKAPSRIKIGLVLFAGEAEVATPPTADHQLVGQAVDDAALFRGYGGTAIGDALATAVQLGKQVVGNSGAQVTASPAPLPTRSLAALRAAAAARNPLVTILFLSDGHQTRGDLAPLDGAALAKAAGFPVYTIALGTTGDTTLRGQGGGFFGGGGGGGFFGGGGGGGGGGIQGLAPDPTTLRAIAKETGGDFFSAQSAGAVQAAYAKLGSNLGRVHAKTEITSDFVALGALLLVLAGGVSLFWAPRLP